MTGTVIPFERPPADGGSPYEIVEITQGIHFNPVEYLVALAGPRKSRDEGRLPWDKIGWFADPAAAIDAAISASKRHGALLIWDGAGIVAPERGSAYYHLDAGTSVSGDAA